MHVSLKVKVINWFESFTLLFFWYQNHFSVKIKNKREREREREKRITTTNYDKWKLQNYLRTCFENDSIDREFKATMYSWVMQSSQKKKKIEGKEVTPRAGPSTGE